MSGSKKSPWSIRVLYTVILITFALAAAVQALQLKSWLQYEPSEPRPIEVYYCDTRPVDCERAER